jgi:hypothetical protein
MFSPCFVSVHHDLKYIPETEPNVFFCGCSFELSPYIAQDLKFGLLDEIK